MSVSALDLASTAHRPIWSDDAVSAQLHSSTHGVSLRGGPNQRIRKTKLDRFTMDRLTRTDDGELRLEIKRAFRFF